MHALDEARHGYLRTRGATLSKLSRRSRAWLMRDLARTVHIFFASVQFSSERMASTISTASAALGRNWNAPPMNSIASTAHAAEYTFVRGVRPPICAVIAERDIDADCGNSFRRHE